MSLNVVALVPPLEICMTGNNMEEDAKIMHARKQCRFDQPSSALPKRCKICLVARKVCVPEVSFAPCGLLRRREQRLTDQPTGATSVPMSAKRLAALGECVALLGKARRNAIQEGLRSSQIGAAACLQQQTSHDSHFQWQRWAALWGATAGVTCLLNQYNGAAQCFVEPGDDDTDSLSIPPPELLARWLTSLGADVEAIDIRHSKAVRSHVDCVSPCPSA